MIVVDASAILEIVLATATGAAIGGRVRGDRVSLHAPQLLDLEVTQVLRRMGLGGELTEERAEQAFEDLLQLPIRRHRHGPLMGRIWQLQQNVTAYDAAYIALAEALDAPLLTRDARLGTAPGHGAMVEVV